MPAYASPSISEITERAAYVAVTWVKETFTSRTTFLGVSEEETTSTTFTWPAAGVTLRLELSTRKPLERRSEVS